MLLPGYQIWVPFSLLFNWSVGNRFLIIDTSTIAVRRTCEAWHLSTRAFKIFLFLLCFSIVYPIQTLIKSLIFRELESNLNFKVMAVNSDMRAKMQSASVDSFKFQVASGPLRLHAERKSIQKFWGQTNFRVQLSILKILVLPRLCASDK